MVEKVGIQHSKTEEFDTLSGYFDDITPSSEGFDVNDKISATTSFKKQMTIQNKPE